ncbi:MAG: class I SAM-dependent methyltransferase [Terriglobia bacterium]
MSLRDSLTRYFFEWGAWLYARKLSWGPEWRLREEFVNFLPAADGRSVLDVGCGPGYVARSLAARGARVIGVDRSRRMARWAARAAQHAGVDDLRFGVAAAECLPFPAGSFDLTLATTVLYLLRDARAGLAEMLRVTRPGGWVATLDPAANLTVETMRAYAAREGLNQHERRQLLRWAHAAQWYGGFSEEKVAGLYRGLHFAEVTLERQLGNLVVFARGRVPTKGRSEL